MRAFFFIYLFVFGIKLAAQTGSIQGVVSNEGLESILFANVLLIQDGTLIKGTTTNLDGIFFLDCIYIGTYNLRFSFVGFKTTVVKNINVSQNKVIIVNTVIEKGVQIVCGGCFFGWIKPLYEKDNTTTEMVYTRSEIINLPY